MRTINRFAAYVLAFFLSLAIAASVAYLLGILAAVAWRAFETFR